MRYILAEDVKSTFNKGYIYGKKGDEVKQITVTGHVAIVEGKKERYPVNINKLIQINT